MSSTKRPPRFQPYVPKPRREMEQEKLHRTKGFDGENCAGEGTVQMKEREEKERRVERAIPDDKELESPTRVQPGRTPSPRITAPTVRQISIQDLINASKESHEPTTSLIAPEATFPKHEPCLTHFDDHSKESPREIFNSSTETIQSTNETESSNFRPLSDKDKYIPKSTSKQKGRGFQNSKTKQEVYQENFPALGTVTTSKKPQHRVTANHPCGGGLAKYLQPISMTTTHNPCGGNYENFQGHATKTSTSDITANTNHLSYFSCSYDHILEAHDFDSSVKTSDLDNFFSDYTFFVKWVDEAHALIIFPSVQVAERALEEKKNSLYISLRRFQDASYKAQQVWKECAHSLQPYQRPQSTAYVAKRLICNSLELGKALTLSAEEEDFKAKQSYAKDVHPPVFSLVQQQEEIFATLDVEDPRKYLKL
eukprot:TRINITY_DN7030_c0_g1_i2.p1 TRINITY_DN7030_c0_g1~~TRINITY_DN7030_c0_g1_i2.p1  ORF type:complete len:443 (+),score=102.66 TRINITY_DN7030_c0_g1_i2:55-1329(+)